MCGICGSIRLNGKEVSIGSVENMAKAMKKRGPDAHGVVAQNNCILGHRRLKIIDLSEQAQQPMVDSTLGLSIVFNGFPQQPDRDVIKIKT